MSLTTKKSTVRTHTSNHPTDLPSPYRFTINQTHRYNHHTDPPSITLCNHNWGDKVERELAFITIMVVQATLVSVYGSMGVHMREYITWKSKSITDPDHGFCMQIVIRLTDFDTHINNRQLQSTFRPIGLHQDVMGIRMVRITKKQTRRKSISHLTSNS